MYCCESFEFIQKNFDLKNNAHSYIFYTNDFLKCRNDIDILIGHIFKNNNLNSLENDLVIINKSDKNNIQKQDVIKIKNLIYNTSYINEKRLYLIEEAEKLNSTSANMILKFLEEPAENIVALFITTNLDLVMQTIKSRCQIIKAFYNNETYYDIESIKIVDDLLKKDKFIAIFEAKNYFKKYDRNELIDIFKDYLNYLSQDIYNLENSNMIRKLNKILKMLNNNVSVDYVFDIFFLEGDVI